MKGTIFSKPIEYNIEAIGEKWHQGEKLKGTLRILNHGTEVAELPVFKVAVCAGNYKKIKARDPKGWVKLEENVLAQNLVVKSNEEKSYSFEFYLKEGSPVTDKNGSLYLAFFDKDDQIPAGHIELVIEPKMAIKQILQILENFLRFKVKEIKSAKGSVEVKLVPPASRELANLESLILTMSEVEKRLSLNYLFNLKSIDLMSPTMAVEKKTKEVEQVFTAKEYLLYGDSLNQDFIIQAAQKAVDSIKTKIL